MLNRRGVLISAVCLAGSGARVATLPAPPRTQTLAKQLAIEPDGISWVPVTSRTIFLTFDDGPDPDHTEFVLDLLDEFEASATFFMIGRNVDHYPNLAREVSARGHVIGNHSQDHIWLDRRSRSTVEAQVGNGERTISTAGLPESRLFRVPHGWTSPTVRDTVRDLGLRSTFWTDCVEARLYHADPPLAAQQVAAAARPGTVILAHDGGRLDGPNPQHMDRRRTMETLPLLLHNLAGRGFRFASLPVHA